MADIIIDGTIGANRLLLLDSTGKIPAVDGSQVTAIAAGNIATGTIPIARIDTGTTANKIVKLDGNAKLPAVDGSLITNVPGATKNSSDPTASTNPSGGVGTEWHNTTSGEVYICTDATAGANVWTNVGEGSGNIAPYSHAGESYGFSVMGHNPPSGRIDTINKFSFASDNNASDHGDATHGANALSGSSSKTHGFHAGGWDASNSNQSSNRMGKFAFSSNTIGTDHGDLTAAIVNGVGCSSETHGYHASGSLQSSNSPQADIQKYAFTSNTTAADVGDLHVTCDNGSTASSPTQGFVAGGSSNGSGQNIVSTIRKWTFASDGNSVGHGDLSGINANAAGCSGETHAIMIGGYSEPATPTLVDKVDKFAYASNTTATDIGNQIAQRFGAAGAGSTTHAYSAGGNNSSETRQNNIQKVAFASGTNTTDVADLTIIVAYQAVGDIQY